MWKELFKKDQELVLATCSPQAEPNANIVMSLGFVDDKLLVADSQMTTTINNLQSTKKACVVAKDKSEYYKIKGTVEIVNSGKYYDLCCNEDKKYPPKNAILISVEEVFDLDKVKRIYPL